MTMATARRATGYDENDWGLGIARLGFMGVIFLCVFNIQLPIETSSGCLSALKIAIEP